MEHSLLNLLPLELREKIYHDYWIARCPCEGWTTIVLQATKVNNASRLTPKDWSIEGPLAPLCRQCTPSQSPLSFTCKQILDEASRVFWRGRSLFFIVETWKDAFRDRYSLSDRISTTCYIRSLILQIAAKWRYAIAGLANIEISIHGFSKCDLPEVLNILQETQQLLSRWRAPAQPIIPIYLRLRETYGGLGMYIRNTRFGTFDDKTLHKHWLDIHFPLVVNIASVSNIDVLQLVYSEYWATRVGNRWYPMFLRQIQWRMPVPPMDSPPNDCTSSPGCRCQIHAGRSLMARDGNVSAGRVLPAKQSRRRRLVARLFLRLAKRRSDG